MRKLTSHGPAIVIACLFSACAPPANAVPIDFSESVSGDLPHPPNPGNSTDFDRFQSFSADSGGNIPAGSVAVDGPAGSVPEPATLGLLGFALVAPGLVGRRRSSSTQRKPPRRTTG